MSMRNCHLDAKDFVVELITLIEIGRELNMQDELQWAKQVMKDRQESDGGVTRNVDWK